MDNVSSAIEIQHPKPEHTALSATDVYRSSSHNVHPSTEEKKKLTEPHNGYGLKAV